MRSFNTFKFTTTQREESYLWKTTHLNTAEEINKGGMKEGGERRGGKPRQSVKKRDRCFCHQQDQVHPHKAAFKIANVYS